MKTIEYRPRWRTCKEPLTLVQCPSRGWFMKLTPTNKDGRRVARFALMCDGSVLWGDAYNVLHKDMCLCRNEKEDSPILIGVLVIDQWWGRAAWRLKATVRMIQWFMGNPKDDRAWKAARSLLDRLEPWYTTSSDLEGIVWPDNPLDLLDDY